ncbi:MAG: YabP/YqfC family sporulation protein [bacterium]
MDKSIITLSNKEHLVISGVNKIIGFDENHFNVDTVLGTLLIKGSGLEMKNLHIENKLLEINGTITSLNYDEIKVNNTFLKKLFK